MKIFLLCIVFAVSLYSETSVCGSWGCISKIEVFFVKSNGNLYVGTPLDEKNANCNPFEGELFTLSKTSSSEYAFSTLLSAYMSNSTIQIRIKEGSPNCEISYVRLHRKY